MANANRNMTATAGPEPFLDQSPCKALLTALCLVLVSVLLPSGCQWIQPPDVQSDAGAGTESELDVEPEASAEMQEGLSTFVEFLNEALETHEAPIEKLDASISHFDAAIAVQPDWAELYVCRAYAAAGLSLTMPGLETEEHWLQTIASASADVDRALKLDPGLADAHLARAFLWSNGIMDIAWKDVDDEEPWFSDDWSDTIVAHLDKATTLDPARADIMAASLLVHYRQALMRLQQTSDMWQDEFSAASFDELSAAWAQLYELYLEEPEAVKPYFAWTTLVQISVQRVTLDAKWANDVQQAGDIALARSPEDTYGHLLRGLADLSVAECDSDEMEAAFREIGIFLESSPFTELAEGEHGCASPMIRRTMEASIPVDSFVLAYICGVD